MSDATPKGRLPGRPGGSHGAELLAIARQMFLERGYAGATMNTLAARARISKQTLYRQYPSKEALYEAVVHDWVDRGRDSVRPHLQTLVETDDVGQGLRRFARVLQEGVLGDPVLQMRTLVAAEAERFPAVAAAYLLRSWDHNQALLADALRQLGARGLLRIDRADVAAEQLTWLTLASPLNRLSLSAGTARHNRAQLDTIADEAVTTFLSRYGDGDGGRGDRARDHGAGSAPTKLPTHSRAT